MQINIIYKVIIYINYQKINTKFINIYILVLFLFLDNNIVSKQFKDFFSKVLVPTKSEKCQDLKLYFLVFSSTMCSFFSNKERHREKFLLG